MPVEVARRALLAGQGLLEDPGRKATPARVHREIERMGFVQVDSINVVCRAHHQILFSRFDGYDPAMLARLLERDRKLFEHWTHDAAVIPMALHRFWRTRWSRQRDALTQRWWRRMGPEPERVVRHVRGRIRREGPLKSADFENDSARSRAGWWDWKPEKRALEFLWRTGELLIARRDSFQKVYDLADRVLPEPVREEPRPRTAEYIDTLCRGALERLGFATPTEIRDFWYGVSIDEARSWCERGLRAGELVQVMVEGSGDAPPQPAFAPADWSRRARPRPDPPARTRLLSPFEPALRDRARTQRLFDFDYRLEAFVPERKRRFGYYVLPILEGERLVGRTDAKLHRDRDLLELRGVWWEPEVRPTARRRRELDRAAGRFAAQLGARDWRVRGKR